MATASSSLLGIFGGSRAKKRHIGDAGSSTVSLDTQLGTGNAGAVSGSGSSAPLNAQQPRSFAQAAGGGPPKRPGPSPPSCPRPQLRRGDPLVEHADYRSMERPAPVTPAPNVLYVDLRSTPLTPEQVLEAAFPVFGKHVLGFQLMAGQKALALVFASEESHSHYLNADIGDTGLKLYPAPSQPVNLLKLTLQGVPFWDTAGVARELPKILHSYGELVFLAPMVTASGWLSDQWHATIARPAGSSALPPEIITLLDEQVIVDIPAQRRYCRHCASSQHIKPSCRQWSRLRSRMHQEAKDLAAVQAAQQQRQQPQQQQEQEQQQQPQTQQQQKQQQHHQQLQQQQQHPQQQQHHLRTPARIPEHWDDNTEAMEDDAPAGGYSAADRFRHATEIVTRAAKDSLSVDPAVVAAAHEYIASVTGTGGGAQ